MSRDWQNDMELLRKPHKNSADVATILEYITPYWMGKSAELKCSRDLAVSTAKEEKERADKAEQHSVELCKQILETEARGMIPWQKYDLENPPETGKNYFVSDGPNADVAFFEKYWDDEPPRWYPPDLSPIHESSITHYATINLPGEEEA